MNREGTKDLTQGSPIKLILEFSIPLLLGLLFQQFYSVVDTIIVGRILGVDALAAVGSTGSINFMIIGFCMGVCNGFGIPIAHRFGANDIKGMKKAVTSAAWLSIVFATVMTIVVAFLCRHILILMQTPTEILEDAYSYIFVIFLGIPVVYLYNVVAGIIRSLGDSKTPVYFLVLASILNIILDFVCIINLQMGVMGAAVATVVSQGVSGVLCLIYIVKKFEILKMEKEDWEIDTHCMKVLCGMGIPMGLQYSITAIGSVILQSAVNTLGATAVAAMTASGKIYMFFCCPFDALGSTMATFGGQNIGAKKLVRIKSGLKSAGLIGSGYAVLAFIVLYFIGRQMIGLFITGDESQVIELAYQAIIINSLFFIPLCFVNIVRFLIQGMGFSRFAILAGVFEMVARTIVGFVFVPKYGFIAACLASPFAWILADIFLIPAFFIVYRKMELFFSQTNIIENS